MYGQVSVLHPPPSPRVADRDRGHWKGVARSGRAHEASGPEDSNANGWRRWWLLGASRNRTKAGEKPEDHKRHVKQPHIPPSRWTQSRTLLTERRIIPYYTEIHRCNQNYSYEFECQARETHRWFLKYRRVKRLVWSMNRFHPVYSVGRNLQTEICGAVRE